MKITIDYESSWRNSFLDGDNNEPLPKHGRKFIGSMTSLRKPENFIEREVTIDTVMGILNRLIGDQRKLYQSRKLQSYFFRDIEEQVTFEDKPTCINQEIAYVRNISGSTDQNSYTGMIKTRDRIFTSGYSSEFWGVLALDLDELCDFITENRKIKASIERDPLSIIARLEEINKMKPIKNVGKINVAYSEIKMRFEKFRGLNRKQQVLPVSLYCSALYLQLNRLSSDGYDLSTAKTRAGGISGVSNNGFTKKDFMNAYTTGDKKRIWGNPYVREEFVKGEGRTKRILKKAGGRLEIKIPMKRDQSKVLLAMIDNAGVSSFYLGKKGLAYVSGIKT